MGWHNLARKCTVKDYSYMVSVWQQISLQMAKICFSNVFKITVVNKSNMASKQ